MSHVGDRLYVTFLDSIGVFDIAANGALTEVAGSPVAIAAANIQVTLLALHPNDKFLYALEWNAMTSEQQVRALQIGAPGPNLLTSVGSPTITPAWSKYIGIRPGTNQLVQTTGDYQLLVWDLDDTTGALSPTAGSPVSFTFPTSPLAQEWHAMAFTADGSRAFVGEYADERLYVVDLAVNGTPTLVRDDIVFASAAETSSCLQVSRDDKTLVVADAFGHLAIYSVAADGTPTDLPNSPWFSLASATTGFAATF